MLERCTYKTIMLRVVYVHLVFLLINPTDLLIFRNLFLSRKS